jgi:predicted GNAT family N-acyltransferase
VKRPAVSRAARPDFPGKVAVRLAVSEGELETAFAVRGAVFIEEQGYTEEQEFDPLDELARHAVATVEGGLGAPIVGTARLLVDEADPRVAVIGRVAVLKENRRSGVGTALVRYMVDEARSLGAKRIRAGAQVGALGFWRSVGFVPTGERYMDFHVPHEWTELRPGEG